MSPKGLDSTYHLPNQSFFSVSFLIKYAIANLDANEVCPLFWWIKYAIANLDANEVCPLFWWIKYAIANLDANELSGG